MDPKIACVGVRALPPSEESLLEEIGAWLVRKGFIVATGNATGSDQAFARGANREDPRRVHLYLPYPDFNASAIHPDNHLICHFDEDTFPGGSFEVPLVCDFERWTQIAIDNHPRPELLNDLTRAFMIRNVGIVEGANQVVARRNQREREKGGTNHSCRVADSLKIPFIDIGSPEGKERIRARLAN